MNKKSINLYKKKTHSFPGQHNDEKIIFIIRKHKITLFFFGLQLLIISLLPMIFYTFIVPIIFPAFLENPYNQIFFLLCLIYYSFLWIIIFVIWVDYYLDIWIITNQRLLNIEQIGFFNRVVSELDLKRIQDITSSVYGLLPTIFGFGNIHIQTAAEEKKFELKSIPHPITVRRKIVELYTQAKKEDRLVFRNKNE